MSITFEDEQGNAPYTPMKAAELASANRQTREYMSARVQDSDEEGEEYPTGYTALKSAGFAKQNRGSYASARANGKRKETFEQWCTNPLEEQLGS